MNEQDRHSTSDPNGLQIVAGDRLEAAFERQAQLFPNAIAIRHRSRSVRYAALDARANRIAHALRALDVGPETLVGLCMPRQPDMIAGILGILKAGGAYLPLDPAYPVARLSYMIEDSGAAVLLTDGSLPSGLNFQGATLSLADASKRLAGLPATRPSAPGDARSLAYVIYTSGSTGQPKGVMLEHTATAFVAWAAAEFPDGELACVAAASSICFDPSVFEIFAPLSTGGTVLLKETPIEPFARDERPTMLNTVPSVLAEMAEAGSIPDSVRVINIGGEKLSIGLVQALYRSSQTERIYNHYGPTEATTCTTVALVSPTESCDPPLGRPICDAEIRIRREDGTDVEGTEEGEIHIAGPMLARGYVNDPVRTAERFLPDPQVRGARLYRTGDIARWGTKGIEFIGRNGDFIKRNGFRIAPAEIEAALLRLPGVRQAAVAMAPDDQGRERLVAYLAGDELEDVQLPRLRQQLRVWLPGHMLPDRVHLEASLPLTLSDKIDRRALPAISAKRQSSDSADFPPIARAAAEIIAAELALAAVGPDDDFFELGGDSLHAVNVALRLEAVLGQPVSPALIAQASTPRLMHEILQHERSAGFLTVLQGNGTAPPIYCLPDVYGRPLSFFSLARELAPDQPVYGLTIGPAADELIARPSLDLLMEGYIAAIRKHQRAGPYRIAGYSFSGRSAQELARRLHAEGEQVSLVLIDAPHAWSRHGIRTSATWAHQKWRQVRAKHGPWAAARRALGYRDSLKSYWLRQAPAALPSWVPAPDRLLAQRHLQAALRHEPRPFGGRSLLVMCKEQRGVNRLLNMDEMLGWRQMLTGPVERIETSVSHLNVVRAPYTTDLAQHIKNFWDAK